VGAELISALFGGLVGYAMASGGKTPTDAEVIEALRSSKPTFFNRLSLNTATTRTNEKHEIVGNFLKVENPEDVDVSVYVRLNELESEPIDLTKEGLIKAPIYRFYITNSAGTGTLNLTVGRAFGFELQDAITKVDIVAQHISELSVDISAQSIGNISVDITAQTIGNIDINAAGSDIQMPIDIQGALIMMPIDIQGQYITLDIDIVAQTVGNISIDLAAQSIGDVTIDINAQTVGVSIQGEWQVEQGNQKNISGGDDDLAPSYYTTLYYDIPVGKVLYIYAASFSIRATDYATDGDKPQIGWGTIYTTSGVTIAQFGGNGGQVFPFGLPIKIVAGDRINFDVYNYAAHNCNIRHCILAYEKSV